MDIPTKYGMIGIGDFREVFSPAGRYLNDHCLFFHGGEWHLFGITGPIGAGCYSGDSECSFAHATSEDLLNWEEKPDVLQVIGSGSDSAHVFAPHVIRRDKRFYLFYTGVDQKRRQCICLSTSSDLYRWHRYEANPIIIPSLFWAKWPGYGQEEGEVGNCRDSHVMEMERGGYIAYWVAELNDSFGKDITCVAASISEDLYHWQEIGPVFTMPRWPEPPTAAVESPCVVKKDGQYWLFFKHGWQTHYVRSDTQLDFSGQASTPLGYCHASEIFEWNDCWHITHCSGMPNDPEYRKTNRTKGLFIGRLDWPSGANPRFGHLGQQSHSLDA